MTVLDRPIYRRKSTPGAKEGPAWVEHFVFRDVDWAFYQAVQRAIGETPVRVNFSDGVLEIMTMGMKHEGWSRWFTLLVSAIAEGSETDAFCVGSMTLKDDFLEKGLEPDESFYVHHYWEMIEKERIDLKTDPPPDLVIEIDITHATVNREAIYAAMKVPEMWRLKDGKLSAHKLVKGKWKQMDRSLAFPFLKVADLNRFVTMGNKSRGVRTMGQVRQWIAALVKAK